MYTPETRESFPLTSPQKRLMTIDQAADNAERSFWKMVKENFDYTHPFNSSYAQGPNPDSAAPSDIQSTPPTQSATEDITETVEEDWPTALSRIASELASDGASIGAQLERSGAS
jgi:hypothetical protein